MDYFTLERFEKAVDKVHEVTKMTRLVYSDSLSHASGNQVYIKPENTQRTGAYKVRGAYYKISTLTDAERATGLITASAGNHAQGVAYAARQYGVRAVVVMPETTPLIKIERTRNLGAEVVLHGSVFDEASAHTRALASEHGYTFVHPFDDLDVAMGQGTMMLEIVRDLPLVDTVLVPIGGGGLATGVSAFAKLLNPRIRVIGVEPAGAACMKASLEAGAVVKLDHASTIADGTAVLEPGHKLFPYLRKNLDGIITVEDDELIDVFQDLADNHKMIVEPSGLLTAAAASHLQAEGKRVVCILSGGNLDAGVLSEVVARSLTKRGRIRQMEAVVHDLGEFTAILDHIADLRARVLSVEQRAGEDNALRLLLTVSAPTEDAYEQIRKELERYGS